MSFLMPRRRPRPKMNLRPPSVVKSPGHLQWLRGCLCCVSGRKDHVCSPGRSHPHHVQSFRAQEGGMGMKVGDDKGVPLCADAHDLVHRKGQKWFEAHFGVDLEKVAADHWNKDSYHRLRWEKKQKEMA